LCHKSSDPTVAVSGRSSKRTGVDRRMTDLLTTFPLVISLVLCEPCVADAADKITVPTILRVLDQADVPARDAELLTAILVRAGDHVEEGQILAQLNDDEEALAVSHAELQLEITRRDAENPLPVQTVETKLLEAQKTRHRVKLAQSIAKRQAVDDVAVRLATKTRDASQADLDRATRSRKSFASSVSLAEIERLQLIVDRNALEIEKAKINREVASLKADMEEARVNEQEQIVARLGLEAEQARRDQATAVTTLKIQEQIVKLARLQVEKRRVRSPLAGVVAEIHRHHGEWVESGTPILRVVRLNRLKAEAFVDAEIAGSGLRGAIASIQIKSQGKQHEQSGEVTFVSPEVDTLSRQVLVSVEIDNLKLMLRPGMKASLTIQIPSQPVAANPR
jgi:multidrug efflux pump subunit AcrA (membrane-fusion protein)